MRTTRIKINRRALYSGAIIIFLLLVLTNGVGAQVECRSDRGGYCLNVGAVASAQAVPGLEFLTLPEGAQPGVLISRLYTFGLGLVGISALLMFIWSGVEYMVARDKEPADAKKRMGNAVFGLLLALLSWILLNTINPNLVRTLDLGLTPLRLRPQEQSQPTRQQSAETQQSTREAGGQRAIEAETGGGEVFESRTIPHFESIPLEQQMRIRQTLLARCEKQEGNKLVERKPEGLGISSLDVIFICIKR